MLDEIYKLILTLYADTLFVISYGDELMRRLAYRIKDISEDRMVRLILVWIILTLIYCFVGRDAI